MRHSGGEPLVSDGPFIEGNELIGGYAEIEVADLGTGNGEELARWRGGRDSPCVRSTESTLISAEHETKIAAQPERVFDFVADAARESEWHPRVKTAADDGTVLKQWMELEPHGMKAGRPGDEGRARQAAREERRSSERQARRRRMIELSRIPSDEDIDARLCDRAQVAGAAVGLREADLLADSLTGYHLFHPARGRFLVELGLYEQARAAELKAARLTENPGEQELLARRLERSAAAPFVNATP